MHICIKIMLIQNWFYNLNIIKMITYENIYIYNMHIQNILLYYHQLSLFKLYNRGLLICF